MAFPKFDINLLAWVAFVPLLQAIEGESMGRTFGYALLQGLVCYVVSLYWIEFTLHHFAGVNPILAAGPLVLLAAVMALFSGLAIWAAQFATVRLGLPIFVTLPIAWPAIEWLRSFFPIGFPWNLLGYTAYRNLELIQFAEIPASTACRPSSCSSMRWFSSSCSGIIRAAYRPGASAP